MPITLLLAATLIPMPSSVQFSEGSLEAKTAKVSYAQESSIPSEGYRLSVNKDGVKITSSTPAGKFYAEQTLEQLKENGKIKFTEIEDAPRYSWRGAMIDDCRHFFGKENLKRVIDLMAQHKLNRLHWHLTDDQGWRIEIPGKPKLTQISAVRAASPRYGTRPHVNMKDISPYLNDEKYGPFFYTEADIKEIIAYAQSKHITIVPEIELPGHFYAALAAYPEFACFPERMKGKGPLCAWGIEKDVLCLGNDNAIKFLEEVLDYVCKLFPGDVVHIGGDECPTVRWKDCAKCKNRVKQEGMKDEHDLQPWITRRMVKFLEERGKRALGWDEYLLGDVPKSAIGMSWRSRSGAGAGHKFLKPEECVSRGHDMVMTPCTHCYFDYNQRIKNDPFQYIGGNITLEKVYSFDPSAGIPENLKKHILGGQCNNWSEYTFNKFDLEWKMWPRTCALAEVLWTGEKRPGFDDFKRRMKNHRTRLINQRVNCAPLE